VFYDEEKEKDLGFYLLFVVVVVVVVFFPFLVMPCRSPVGPSGEESSESCSWNTTLLHGEEEETR